MANKRSAMKAQRVAERRHERNRAVKSALRTFVKKARTDIEGAPDGATASVALAAKQLDAAVNKGIIHRNQAARRKSRLMRQLARVTAQAAEATTEKKAPTTRSRAGTGRTGTTRSRTTSGTTRSTTSRSTTSRSTTSRSRTNK